MQVIGAKTDDPDMPSFSNNNLLVGRKSEMVELSAAFESACEGSGGIAMLVGEPGIGKTRLTEELVNSAAEQKALIGWGACYEGGSAPPYWPWTQLIRFLLNEPSDSVLAALEPRAAVISEIVPDVRRIFANRDLGLPPDLDPQQARFRLFESVASLLAEISDSQPIVIALDDLHWADRPSLELLEFVARGLSTTKVLVVGTYRDTALSRRHPLSETLANLARLRGFIRLPVRGIESDEVGQLVESVGDITLPTALIAEIYDRTEGNPFFISEVTRDIAREASQRGGDFDAVMFRIPEGIREAVGVRLNQLSETCNEILQTAAVIGRKFDFKLLASMSSDLSEDELLSAVQEAIGASTVRELAGGGERYEFTHALIQQTLAEELSVSQRTRLHAQVVAAMEEIFADRVDDHTAEMAYHCEQAGGAVDSQKTIRWSYAAGERSLVAGSWPEAEDYFRRGLAASADGDTNARRGDLLLRMADSQNPQGIDPSNVVKTLTSAFDAYQLEGNKAGAINAAATGLFRGPNDAPEHFELCRRGMALVEAGSYDAARMLNEYGIALGAGASRYEEGQKMLAEALSIARQIEDRALEVHIVHNVGFIHMSAGEFEEALDKSIELLDLLKDIEVPAMEVNAHRTAAVGYMSFGQTSKARYHSEEALGVSIRKKVLGEQATIYDYFLNCGVALNEGRWDDAVTYSQMDQSFLGEPIIFGAEEVVEFMTGDQAAAIESLLGHLPVLRLDARLGYQFLVIILGFIAEFARRTGDEQAIKEIQRDVATVLSEPRVTGLSFEAAEIVQVIFTVAHSNDQVALAKLYDDFRDSSGMYLYFSLVMSSDRLLALLAMASGQTSAVSGHFEKAIELSEKASLFPELGWSLLDYSNFLYEQGGPVDIAKLPALIDRGLEVARPLGMKPLENQLTELRTRVGETSASTAPFPDGLTPREVEVLYQLAAGATNQQIADELVITLNTVTSHVANILGKTGSANRTEAAVYATQRGLIEA